MWVLVIAAAIGVGVTSGRDEFMVWIPIVYAGSILLTFGIQLATGRTEGYVTRALVTLAGSTAIAVVATAILWLIP